MTCFGCATLMNLGARKARFAPGSFLIGSFLLCGSLYLAPYYRGPVQFAAGCIGSAGLLFGWIVLIAAAGSVDRGDPCNLTWAGRPRACRPSKPPRAPHPDRKYAGSGKMCALRVDTGWSRNI